jgi:hypothetical protein
MRAATKDGQPQQREASVVRRIETEAETNTQTIGEAAGVQTRLLPGAKTGYNTGRWKRLFTEENYANLPIGRIGTTGFPDLRKSAFPQ